MPPYAIALLIVLIVAVVVLLTVLVLRSSRRTSDTALQMLQQQLSSTSTQQDTRLAQINEQLTTAIQNLTTNLNDRLAQNQNFSQQVQKSISERLEATGRTFADLKGQLGQLSQATDNVMRVGSEVRKLQDILQSPKLRGGLGEWSLANLLAEVLPQKHYHLQHRFKSGHAVDALVQLAQGSVAIDAKFPLENFRAMLAAADDAARQKLRRAFLKDVRGRIDEIAQKYIVPAEGTLDFALMYVPAENVYYEIITASGPDSDIGVYSRDKKVLCVGPNSLYAYLMVIATGLKGLQIEQNAQIIRRSLTQFGSDLGLFVGDFATVGKHLVNAKAKHDDAGRKLDNLTNRLQQMQTPSSADEDSGAEDDDQIDTHN